MEEMRVFLDTQKKQGEAITKMEASLSTLEMAYINLAKAHATLQQDIKTEKEKNKKSGKFMVKMWRGIKAIFK